MIDRLYNEKEAADYLGISKNKLNEFIRDKKLPAYKIGGQFLRFYQKDLDAIKKEPHPDHSVFAKLKDYIYYNDFYIIVAILIIILLALIFKVSF